MICAPSIWDSGLQGDYQHATNLQTRLAVLVIRVGCDYRQAASGHRRRIDASEAKPQVLVEGMQALGITTSMDGNATAGPDSAVLPAIFANAIQAGWVGEVVRGVNGDAVEVLKGGATPVKTRWESIDTSETGQPFVVCQAGGTRTGRPAEPVQSTSVAGCIDS